MTTAAPLRILHCVRAAYGGIFRHVQDLAREQTAQGHTVGVVCDSIMGGDFEAERIARLAPDLALGVTRLPMRRELSLADLGSARSIMSLVGALEPDVLHGHGAKGAAYGRVIGRWLGRRGKKPVGTFYAPHGGSLHYDPKSLQGRVYFGIERALERLTDGLVFVSEYERDAYQNRIGRPRVPYVLVRNGLRPDEFEPIAFEPDRADFLFIGVLRDLKGTDVFLDALRILSGERGRTFTALVVGEGEDRERYIAMADEYGLSPFTRFELQMPARRAFARTRSVIVPSRAESSPYIVLETIAAAMPIVATRVGGIPEIMADDAHLLVEPGNAGALADAMQALLDAPEAAAQAAIARRDWFKRRHTISGMARRISAFYREARPDLASS